MSQENKQIQLLQAEIEMIGAKKILLDGVDAEIRRSMLADSPPTLRTIYMPRRLRSVECFMSAIVDRMQPY